MKARETEAEYTWLFRTEYPLVVRTVFLILHDAGRAEEIAQEAFTTLFVHWRRVSKYERPDAWVRKVAIRLAIRGVRRDRRRAALEVGAHEDRPFHQTVPDADLARAIASLPAMQRACVVLCYFEDRPTEEVADILRIAESTARVHLTRARKRLAELLGEEVSEDAT